MDKGGIYNTWHGYKYHKVFHWSAFLIITLVLTVSIVRSIQVEATTAITNSNKSLSQLTVDLLNTNNKLRHASVAERPQLLQELLSIAQERKALQLSFLESNPKEILRTSLSTGLLNQMPEEVRGMVEQHQLISGIFTQTIGENNDTEAVKNFYSIKDNKGVKQNLYLEGIPSAKTGDVVKVDAISLGGTLAAGGSGAQSVQVTQSLSAPLVSGSQRVLVLLVNFQDDATQPATVSQVVSNMFNTTAGAKSVATYYDEASYGNVTVTGDVKGWFTLSMTKSSFSCATMNSNDQMATLAKQAATAAGVDVSAYQKYVYIHPLVSGCFSGLARVGGNEAWMNQAADWSTIAHEMGHNFGLYHAHRLACSGVSLCSSGTVVDYGHMVDLMGNGGNDRHFYSYQKERIGLLNTATTPPITTVSSGGVYTISPMAVKNSSPKALKIHTTTGMDYYVEYRTAVGYDYYLSYGYPGSNLTKGIVVSLGDPANGNNQYQLDMTPETTTWADSALVPGKSYTDAAAGVTITPLSVSDTGAQVQVTFGSTPPPTCTNVTPTLTITPTTQTGTAGSTLSYSLTLKNNDTTACASSTYTITPTLPTGWYMTPGTFTETLAPGASVSETFSITSSDTGSGTNTITLKAQSTNTSTTASTVFNISTPPPPSDTIPPLVTITKPVNNSTVPTKGNLSIAVTASDNSGTVSSIKIYFDGILIKTCTSVTSCSFSKKVSTISSGTHTITATATDPTGNTGTATSVGVVR